MKKPTLTRRQKQVLCLATFSNRQIASILGISDRTVAHHFTALYERLDLGHVSQAQGCRRIVAVTEALRLGLVTLDDIAPGDRPMKAGGGTEN